MSSIIPTVPGELSTFPLNNGSVNLLTNMNNSHTNTVTDFNNVSVPTSSNYVLLDFSSKDENNMNIIEFTKASFMIINSTTYEVYDKQAIDLIDNKDNKLDSKFQQFIQILTDSIHSNCILKEIPFYFVSVKCWDFRVKFIKHSKNIKAQLPNYLEYPTYFDLKKEFIKYEELNGFSKFNSIKYNLLDLSLMKEKLNIVKNNKETNDDLKFNDDNLSDILVIIKSVRENDKSKQVFTKPHDMNMDLSYFFIEKSRVVYLTNLPSDITQSDLEFWFQKINAKSITFSILKNPILYNHLMILQNEFNNNTTPKKCSGFAIFQSHEDAVESLTMNGEILNENMIEIEPSSTKVLEKAQEILGQFPSSKNKPRPGDWSCPSCGFSNFQRRTACFRCSFPAASAVAVQESISGNSTYNNGSSSTINSMNYKSRNNSSGNNTNSYNNNTNNNSNVNLNITNNNNNNSNNYMMKSNDYKQYNNNTDINNFNINGYNNGYNNGYTNYNNNGYNKNNYNNNNNSNHYYNNNNNGNSNGNNGNNGNNSGYSSRQSSNVPFRAGDWKCINDNCAYHNFAKNLCCLKCGAPRSQNAIMNGHPHNQHHNYIHNKNDDGNNNNSNNNNNNNYNNFNNNNNNNGNNNYSNTTHHSTNNQMNYNNNNGMNYNNNNNNANGYNKGNNNVLNNPHNLHILENNFNTRSNSLPQFNTNTTNTNNNIGTNSSTISTPNVYSSLDFDLVNRIGGLSLNNTGNQNINNGFNNNEINNNGFINNTINSMNLNGLNGLNSLGGLNGLNGLGGLGGLNGLNALNGLNGVSGLNQINNKFNTDDGFMSNLNISPFSVMNDNLNSTGFSNSNSAGTSVNASAGGSSVGNLNGSRFSGFDSFNNITSPILPVDGKRFGEIENKKGFE
ncbi:Nrp1 protein [Pichia kluyveri]|uniref:Nrp1 protein n=1 Tax=Pichia kluyveri TaxID=36015 RepID=A0AAV5R139_PICKL|nr:Nrp1 protein [Pichia kluyveri]